MTDAALTEKVSATTNAVGFTGWLEERPRRAFGAHESARMKNDEWLTPPEILQALGPFDLDPCAPSKRPWDMARTHITLHENGLRQVWQGRVWLNPPYSREARHWLSRLADHGNGIALIFARTETETWHTYVWRAADAILFLKGRLHFYLVNGRRAPGNAGAPCALIAYGQENVNALRESGISGALITDWSGSSCRSPNENSTQFLDISREIPIFWV